MSLECDEDGGQTAMQAQKAFHIIYDDNDWLSEEEGQEEKVITKEEFASRIGISV